MYLQFKILYLEYFWNTQTESLNFHFLRIALEDLTADL